MSDYPLPSYAASFWVVGDQLFVRLPPWATGGPAHIITLPANEAGMKICLDLLKERARASYETKIGTKAAPVQYDIDAMLRRMGAAGPTVTKLPPQLKQAAKPTLSLDDLDL